MRNVDPATIPETGERYDQTLIQVGKGRSWHPKKDSRADAIIIKSVIDNGEYKGKRISAPFFQSKKEKLREFAAQVGFPDLPLAVDEQTILTLQSTVGSRFSSLIRTVTFETDEGEYLRYNMTFFDDPLGPRRIDLNLEPTQFQR